MKKTLGRDIPSNWEESRSSVPSSTESQNTCTAQHHDRVRTAFVEKYDQSKTPNGIFLNRVFSIQNDILIAIEITPYNRDETTPCRSQEHSERIGELEDNRWTSSR